MANYVILMLTPKHDLISYLLKRKRRVKHYKPPSELSKKSPDINNLNLSESKGYKFEKFVVSLFNPEYFTLLEWRSVKSHDGVFPISCQFPDLEFYFQTKTEALHFAIECKWRQYFHYDKLVWTNENQLENYKQFENISNIPVFLVLGVGGLPEKPNEIYSIPLREIDSTVLHSFILPPYQCNQENCRAYLNCDIPSLHW